MTAFLLSFLESGSTIFKIYKSSMVKQVSQKKNDRKEPTADYSPSKAATSDNLSQDIVSRQVYISCLDKTMATDWSSIPLNSFYRKLTKLSKLNTIKSELKCFNSFAVNLSKANINVQLVQSSKQFKEKLNDKFYSNRFTLYLLQQSYMQVTRHTA